VKAITAEFKGPNGVRGSRILARDSDGNRVTFGYHNGSGDEYSKHRAAAIMLCEKLGWSGGETLIGGGIRGGYAFVFAPSQSGSALPCVTCSRITVGGGSLDPRGEAGLLANAPFVAVDHGAVGADVPQCYGCHRRKCRG